MYRLIPFTPAYADQVAAYRQEFLETNSSMDGTGFLAQYEDPLAWLEECRRFTDEATVPPDKVPATQFFCIRQADDRLVGMLQVRHRFNDYLALYGGHIGYSVRPADRRQGVARFMLAAALPLCKELGLDRVLITCLEGNEGSKRTILACGGAFEGTIVEPNIQKRLERYWIDLCKGN